MRLLLCLLFLVWLPSYSGIQWVHIPKTGSAFAGVLLDYYCPQSKHSALYYMHKYGPQIALIMGHDSHLSKCYHTLLRQQAVYISDAHSAYDQDKGPIITLLRDPYERLISLFHYWAGSTTHPREFTWNVFRGEFKVFLKRVDTQNQMIRQILGPEYYNNNSNGLRFDNISDALDILNGGFVGFTTHFKQSVCLFFRMHNNSNLPNHQVNKLRKSKYMTHESTGIFPHVWSYKVIHEIEYEIPAFQIYDRILYSVVFDRFVKLLEKYPECK